MKLWHLNNMVLHFHAMEFNNIWKEDKSSFKAINNTQLHTSFDQLFNFGWCIQHYWLLVTRNFWSNRTVDPSFIVTRFLVFVKFLRKIYRGLKYHMRYYSHYFEYITLYRLRTSCMKWSARDFSKILKFSKSVHDAVLSKLRLPTS